MSKTNDQDHDYLWDGTGEADPDVQRLERLLGQLRGAPPSLMLPQVAARWRFRSLLPALATAAAVILMIAIVWRTRTSTSWPVEKIAGTPHIGAAALQATGRLAVGDTLTTDASSRARIEVSSIGQVVVDTGSNVRLVETRSGRHRLALQRGTLHAMITATPGQFVVDTPSATATDLGCRYDLTVDDRGAGRLSVIFGWVAFDFKGRESFVPAGASCRTEPGAGPGTPYYDDAEKDVQEALQVLDFEGKFDRASTLRFVLDRARTRDAFTLWHLLSRVHPVERGEVFDALAARVPPPAGVTREAILALDQPALEAWWNALRLGDVSFWRYWKRPLPAPK